MRCRARPMSGVVFETTMSLQDQSLGVKGRASRAIGSCPAVRHAIIEGLWREYKIDTSICSDRGTGLDRDPRASAAHSL